MSRMLQQSGVPAHRIKLEITERALVNSEIAYLLVQKFRARGHKVAIDDFGTGYSSLSYLQSFELDALKIDKRSEEHTSELQSLMRISYAVFCLKKKNKTKHTI